VRIWHIMVAGALAIPLLGEISPDKAWLAVDWNVVAYLFGVFAIESALYDTGVSHLIGARIAAMTSQRAALATVIAATKLCSAVLTNEASAVIGTPIILKLTRTLRLPARPLLIALCATVTVGSMLSPVGNPQNIPIATRGHFGNPVATFLLWLTVPAILSLLVVLIGADSVLQGLGSDATFPFGIASLIACAPVFLFNANRAQVLRALDWPTIAFFVAMFIVTGLLLESGSLQAMLGSRQADLGELPVIALVSFWASQVFSNVPVVEIYLNLVKDWEVHELMMLAGISTLAGNLIIISAASNVIMVQQAERFGETPFKFWQFTLSVLPIAVASLAITYAWIAWFTTLV
jgi:Na+/H+ antiporter NhaD/arsenite permease-like protein